MPFPDPSHKGRPKMRLGMFGRVAPRIARQIVEDPDLVPPEQQRAGGLGMMMHGVRGAAERAPDREPRGMGRIGQVMASAAAPQRLGMMGHGPAIASASPSAQVKGALMTAAPDQMARGSAERASPQGSQQPYKAPSVWDEMWSDPMTFFLTGTDGLDRKRDMQKAEDTKRQLASTLDSLNLSPQERVRAEMDPEGFFRGLNEANTAQMKPQTDTFYDPVSKQWMRKPLGPMAVAQGTDLVDPETNAMLYSNDAPDKIEPTKYAFENFGGKVWAVNPANPKDRIEMGPAPQGTPAAPKATYRWATPDEVKAAGLTPNTAVQINNETGEAVIKGRPSTAQTGQPTEGERNAGMHVSVSLNGLKNITDMETGGYNRAGFGEQFSTLFGQNEKLYDQAAAEFIDGYLRAMTGAAATASEIATYRNQWFPQFGDNENVVKQKAAGRLNAIQAMKSKSGRAWNPQWDGIIAQLQQQVGGAANQIAPPPSTPPQQQLPPGVTQEMWDVMDDEDRAAFQ